MGVSAADVFAAPLGEIFGCFAMDDYEAWRGNVGKLFCFGAEQQIHQRGIDEIDVAARLMFGE